MNVATRDLARACDRAIDEQRHRGRGRFGQRFHLMPCAGWLNDPNGLYQKDGIFHAYYQCSPFNAEGGLKFWGHATSRDLVTWEDRGVVLYPDTRFDCHGVYSGSALPCDGDAVFADTGNVKEDEAGRDHDFIVSGRQGNTLVVASPDGQRFSEKRLVLSNADYPADVSCHVRDPKLFVTDEGWGMVLGARRLGETRDEDAGEVLVYTSPDLDSWTLANRVTTPERFGYMWECPDYFELDGVKLLACSPQGLTGPQWDGKNIYQSGWFRLEGDVLGQCELGEFALWDHGFDFYAPQTFQAEDGRRILIGWMGMADTPAEKNPTLDHGWQHCFTVPREVTWDGSRVLTRPVRELGGHRRAQVQARGHLTLADRPCFDLLVEGVLNDRCSVRLARDLELAFDAETSELVLRFSGPVGAGRGERRAHVGGLRSLRVVGDCSSVEVFANDGETVFSTRYYPERYEVAVDAPDANVTAWELAVPTADLTLVPRSA